MTLLNQTHYELVKGLLNEAFSQPAKRRWTDKNLRTKLATDIFYGLFSDHKLIAVYALRCNSPRDVAYLYGVCVDRKFRGQGFGRHIVDDATERVSMLTCILHLEITERRAIEWYLRKGFKPYHYQTDVVWMVRYPAK